MRYGAWNKSSQYGSGSLTTAARELASYQLVSLGVQAVSRDKGGIVRAGDCIFLIENHAKIINLEQVFLSTTEQYQQLNQ
jgi:hypothetical protein